MFMQRGFYIGLLQHGSLEVALGAVAMSLALSRALEVKVPPVVYVSLFCAVWFIYLLDRLFDAKKIAQPAANPRHRFYQRFHAELTTLLIASGLAGLVTLPLLPVSVLTTGAILMGLCMLYLLWVYLSGKPFPKELVVAMLYAAGVSLGPLSVSWHEMIPGGLLLVLPVFCLALINLLLFSKADEKYDLADGQLSSVSVLSELQLNRVLLLLFSLLIAALFLVYRFCEAPDARLYFLLMLVMATVLWLLHIRRASFADPQWFRWIGDGIFLLPLLTAI